jgi:hypothetical protein
MFKYCYRIYIGMSESGSSVTNNNESKDIFEDYRKTCSVVFGKASQSQIKYIEALSDLQQAMWTSCESLVAKQISALEEYSKTNHSTSYLELPLQIYSRMIDASMKWVSASYDLGVVRLQIYRKNVEHLNDMMSQAFSFKRQQNEAKAE